MFLTLRYQLKMLDIDSPNYQNEHWMNDEFMEAYEDFQSLQTLTASLIFRILTTRYELEGRVQVEEDLSVMDAYRLRHADEYAVPAPASCYKHLYTHEWYGNRVLIALQNIEDDTDTLITEFNRPTKTFFEANLDQSRLITRLSMLLVSIQPFLPAASSEDHPAWAGYLHDRLRVGKDNPNRATRGDSVRSQDERDTPTRDRRKVKGGGAATRGEHDGNVGAACFDREPRSRSVLPSNHAVAERELRWAAPLSL